MRILHTSDWHLGRSLHGRKRYEEFDGFLTWLAETIRQEAVEVLIVAGDIFDNTTPSNRAQALYYQFLCQVAASNCRHVVVVAGNHDSPTFLDAPRELLKALNVHVVGQASDTPDDEVLVLRDSADQPELIVCAVPYLRDRDIRTAAAGESIEDKEQKLIEGIRQHYARIGELAESRREAMADPVPIVGTGHLFAAGGQTIDGDGVRELYVGSLAHVTAQIFPACFDYVALGHLHVPQKVNGQDKIRYSGSPLPMGFGEATQQKSVCLVDFESADAGPAITLLDIPRFQKLARVSGDWAAISKNIQTLVHSAASAWLEVVYEGEEVISDLREQLDLLIQDTAVDILRIKNRRVADRVLEQFHEEETLADLNPSEVFDRCLEAHAVPSDQRAGLLDAYQETLRSLQEDDVRAE